MCHYDMIEGTRETTGVTGASTDVVQQHILTRTPTQNLQVDSVRRARVPMSVNTRGPCTITRWAELHRIESFSGVLRQVFAHVPCFSGVPSSGCIRRRVLIISSCLSTTLAVRKRGDSRSSVIATAHLDLA